MSGFFAQSAPATVEPMDVLSEPYAETALYNDQGSALSGNQLLGFITQLALQQIAEGDYELGSDVFDRVTSSFGDSEAAPAWKAMAMVTRGKASEAFSLLEAVRMEHGDYPSALHSAATALAAKSAGRQEWRRYADRAMSSSDDETARKLVYLIEKMG
jgi:Bacterial type III secretion protein (HrpB1_HrpK)